MTDYVVLSNSTIMDYNSFGSTAPAPSGGTAVTSTTINVALVLQRANDPTALLQSDWATRQSALADQATIWQQYGATSAGYASASSAVSALGLETVNEVGSNGYVSSQASRTIWVSLTVDSSGPGGRDDFATLFNASLYRTSGDVYYWGDSSGNAVNLSLPDSLTSAGVTELAFDSYMFANPILPGAPTTSAAVLSPGSQSPGNAAPVAYKTSAFPQDIAEDFYNFPLSGAVVTSGAIGLIEPAIGGAMQSGAPSFASALDDYRSIALSGAVVSGVDVQVVASGGQVFISGDAGERSLDAGVVTTLAQGATLVLYAGSGEFPGAGSTVFTAFQTAFWDDANNPAVITNSFDTLVQASPDSPFQNAILDLFIDGALHNISTFNSDGDTGSYYHVANGVTNVPYSRATPYAVMVGGTSLSSLESAENDPTLSSYLSPSLDALWQMVAGGLTIAPGDFTDPQLQRFIETAWNQYSVDTADSPVHINGYFDNVAGTGGVDPTQPVPWYQQAFGLDPETTDGRALHGRGLPDVSANAGGNAWYAVPNTDMDGIEGVYGTSAAAPFWAGLIAQINFVFADQGLPQLGFMNDLLYMAAVIDPGSFNDITIGNNISSFEFGGTEYESANTPVTPTGYGYQASPGYDLVTGLGTPNGLLLARSLTQIAHSQVSFSSGPDAVPDVIVSDGSGGWQAGADQSLLFQTMAGTGTSIDLDIGGGSTSFSNATTASFAWTSRMAQQSLQEGFDANLVTMFDGQQQGTLVQATVATGDSISVDIASTATEAKQATLSQSFGFADFMTSDNSAAVRVAQPVAVAETAGGADNQEAIVRIRQNGMSDSLLLQFYRVDDYEGTIGSLHPGEAGYVEAAASRAYELSTGGTTIGGPGYGQYTETNLQAVDAGDLVAMLLRNASSTFFAFAPGNETVSGKSVAHLWNYGANSWGWEDAWGGGDRDYNDVVVQVDFTSKAGSGLLAGSSG